MTSIIQFADVHFGVEDRDAMAAVKAYVDTLEPDCILICGDITQDGKIEEFEAARDWIAKFNVPCVATPGNHDTPTFGIFHRLFNPWGRYNKYIRPLCSPFYKDDTVMITTMNTARGVQASLDWSLGAVDMGVLSNKIQELSQAGPDILKMIAVHHPFIYPEISPLKKTTKNGTAAIKVLSDANIDAVISGHIHTPFFIGRKPGETGLISFGSGTLSTRQRGTPASFNHIKIDDKTLAVTAINWIDGAFKTSEPWIAVRDSLSKHDVQL